MVDEGLEEAAGWVSTLRMRRSEGEDAGKYLKKSMVGGGRGCGTRRWGRGVR
jgi:hypothetical protein